MAVYIVPPVPLLHRPEAVTVAWIGSNCSIGWTPGHRLAIIYSMRDTKLTDVEQALGIRDGHSDIISAQPGKASKWRYYQFQVAKNNRVPGPWHVVPMRCQFLPRLQSFCSGGDV